MHWFGIGMFTLLKERQRVRETTTGHDDGGGLKGCEIIPVVPFFSLTLFHIQDIRFSPKLCVYRKGKGHLPDKRAEKAMGINRRHNLFVFLDRRVKCGVKL